MSDQLLSRAEFWQTLDKLVAENPLVIDRPAGSAHPRYPHLIYPLDYGYLQGTTAMDGDGIDVWLGTDAAKRLAGVLCFVDMVKRDSEIKLLIGCTEEETQRVYKLHNETEFAKAILILREK